MRAEGSKRVHLLSLFPSSSPNRHPHHRHTKEILIFPVYFLSLLPSQSNNPSFVPSNGCPFKKLFPSLKISYVPCSLIWSLFLSKSSIYFVLSHLKNVPFPPKCLGGNMSIMLMFCIIQCKLKIQISILIFTFYIINQIYIIIFHPNSLVILEK